jgi:hypothetical protein
MESRAKMSGIQKTARLAGFLYFLLIPFGVFGMLYVPAQLFVPGDTAATAQNIMATEALFRASTLSALITQVIQIIVVFFLYSVLKPAGRRPALLMVVFILMGVPIAMFNEVSHLAVLTMLGGKSFSTAFTTEQVTAFVGLAIDSRKAGIFIAQIFWGLWLFPMGYLVFKSGFLPKVIGILLIVAGFGYLADSFTYFMVPDFGIKFSDFTFLGELLITLWLLVKGVNVEVWTKRSMEASELQA